MFPRKDNRVYEMDSLEFAEVSIFLSRSELLLTSLHCWSCLRLACVVFVVLKMNENIDELPY